MENDKFYIVLSEEQKKAYYNAQLISQIEIAGGIIGICHLLGEAEDGKAFWQIFLEGLAISATCSAVARFVYPVRTKDLLTFSEQDTKNDKPQFLSKMKQNLGNTTQTKSEGGVNTVSAVAMGVASLSNMLSSIFGGGEETKQVQAQANAQINIAKEQVNIQNAQNTGLVYNSLANNAKSQNDLALQRQRQTIQIIAIGGVLALGMYGIYAFSQKKEKKKE